MARRPFYLPTGAMGGGIGELGPNPLFIPRDNSVSLLTGQGGLGLGAKPLVVHTPQNALGPGPGTASDTGSLLPGTSATGSGGPAPWAPMGPSGAGGGDFREWMRSSFGGERSPVTRGGGAGILEAVAPLMSDWRTTPAQVLASAFGGYARGAQGARQEQKAEERQAKKDLREEEVFGLQRQQFEAEVAKAEQKAAEEAELDQYISSLPPEWQLAAKMDRKGFGEAYAKNVLFPEEKEPIKLGNQLLDPDTYEVITTAPFAPPAPRAPTETWRTLSEAEVAKRGLPKGSVVQESNLTGAVQDRYIPPSGGSETWRTLTPEEVAIARLPEGTSAQVNEKGKVITTHTPSSREAGMPIGFEPSKISESAKRAGVPEASSVIAPKPGSEPYAKAVGTISSVTKYRKNLQELSDLFDKVGVTIMPGEALGRYNSLRNALKINYAQAHEQGALQATDDAVISAIIGAPTDPWKLGPGGADQVRAQIDSAVGMADQDVTGLAQQYPWYDIKPTWEKPKSKTSGISSPGVALRAGGAVPLPGSNAAPGTNDSIIDQGW